MYYQNRQFIRRVFNCRISIIKDLFRRRYTLSTDKGFESLAKKFVSGTVKLDKDELTGTAVISLDNKEKKNAISGSMMCDLRNIIADLETWEAGKGVIMRGEGGTFCSGGDLDTVRNILSPEAGYQMSLYMNESLKRFSKLPMISVALVEGNALGGGAELAMSCDFMVMSDKARFGFVQTKMGLITGWGAGTRLVRKFGSSKALEVLASGRMMDAVECKRLGFANEVFPHSDKLLDVTKSWLEQYCSADKRVIRNLKSVVSNAIFLSVEESSAKENKLFSELWGGEANLKALGDKIKH